MLLSLRPMWRGRKSGRQTTSSPRGSGISRISLMGWSWGTVTMGAYTADHNDKVERLVLYAPVWLTASPPSQTARPALGAYVSAPMATARDRLQAGAPDDRKNDLMPVSW